MKAAYFRKIVQAHDYNPHRRGWDEKDSLSVQWSQSTFAGDF